jgi:nucleoid DNA-binding protein
MARPKGASRRPTELVTVRNPDTGEEREIPRGAVPYFPAYVLLKKDGSVNPNPATATPKG